MSFVAAAAGAAIVARPLTAARVLARISTNTCTAVGALTITGFALVVRPYVKVRAPLDYYQREDLRADFCTLIGPPPETQQEQASGSLLRFGFEDLRRPWLFDVFTWACRAVFAAYADATGVMTQTEFRGALHKMIDITWTWYNEDDSQAAMQAQAAAVRKLLERIANGAFRVIDQDGDGRIDAAEFTGAVLLVLVVANGKAVGDAPILSRLAFRVVDRAGNGKITQSELQRWVELALEHGTAPEGAQREPRGPWGLFGTRVLSPAQLTRKWMRVADVDKDGVLSQEEFATIATSIRVHEVISRLAKNFAIS